MLASPSALVRSPYNIGFCSQPGWGSWVPLCSSRPTPDPHPLPLGADPQVLPSLHAQARAGAGRGRQGQAGQHSLAAGGVDQQRDEGGGGRADTVQRQHGVFALLFADDVI